MNKLPQVLQKEIWEYVRGDREYWKIQHDIVVLGLRLDSHKTHVTHGYDCGKFAIEIGPIDDDRWLHSIHVYTHDTIARYPPVHSEAECGSRVKALLLRLRHRN
jgi:hypothetical protein